MGSRGQDRRRRRRRPSQKRDASCDGHGSKFAQRRFFPEFEARFMSVNSKGEEANFFLYKLSRPRNWRRLAWLSTAARSPSNPYFFSFRVRSLQSWIEVEEVLRRWGRGWGQNTQRPPLPWGHNHMRCHGGGGGGGDGLEPSTPTRGRPRS